MSALVQSPFFGLALSVVAYLIGAAAQKRIRFALCNTMVVSTMIVIAVLLACGITYDEYYVGGYFINLFVSPATVCLALGIYDKIPLLKKNLVPVLAGCITGMIACVICVWVMCRLLGNLFAPVLQKLLKTDDALAMGLAVGASSHAMGTAKAMEMDKTIGAMSGLAIGVCGVIVAVGGLFFGFLL